MNKYIILMIIVAVIVGGGILYRVVFQSDDARPVSTGEIRNVTVIAKKNEWRFVPEEIEVNRGDRVIMKVINEDDYDHGIAIDAFGVSQRMPALGTITVDFVATQPGEFPFYCSVPCGEGPVDGKVRTHFDMIGKVKVKDLVKAQQ